MDWEKYEAYRESIMNTLKGVFSTVDDNDFYDLFQDCYLECFPIFENKFNPEISNNEKGFLYRLISRKMYDKLNKAKKVKIGLNKFYFDLGENKPNTEVPEMFEFAPNKVTQTFAGFLHKMISNRSAEPLNYESKVAINRHYSAFSTIIRREAWSNNSGLSESQLIGLSEKVKSDTESERYWDWREPMPIVRLKSWVSCS